MNLTAVIGRPTQAVERTDTALRAVPPLTAHSVGRQKLKELRWRYWLLL